jgi:hypothetical protein
MNLLDADDRKEPERDDDCYEAERKNVAKVNTGLALSGFFSIKFNQVMPKGSHLHTPSTRPSRTDPLSASRRGGDRASATA